MSIPVFFYCLIFCVSILQFHEFVLYVNYFINSDFWIWVQIQLDESESEKSKTLAFSKTLWRLFLLKVFGLTTYSGKGGTLGTGTGPYCGAGVTFFFGVLSRYVVKRCDYFEEEEFGVGISIKRPSLDTNFEAAADKLTENLKSESNSGTSSLTKTSNKTFNRLNKSTPIKHLFSVLSTPFDLPVFLVNLYRTLCQCFSYNKTTVKTNNNFLTNYNKFFTTNPLNFLFDPFIKHYLLPLRRQYLYRLSADSLLHSGSKHSSLMSKFRQQALGNQNAAHVNQRLNSSGDGQHPKVAQVYLLMDSMKYKEAVKHIEKMESDCGGSSGSKSGGGGGSDSAKTVKQADWEALRVLKCIALHNLGRYEEVETLVREIKRVNFEAAGSEGTNPPLPMGQQSKLAPFRNNVAIQIWEYFLTGYVKCVPIVSTDARELHSKMIGPAAGRSSIDSEMTKEYFLSCLRMGDFGAAAGLGMKFFVKTKNPRYSYIVLIDCFVVHYELFKFLFTIVS